MKLPAPILPQPGATGASQGANVVQQSIAPQKAPTPQLLSLFGMSQNQNSSPQTTPTQATATPTNQKFNPLFNMYRLPQ